MRFFEISILSIFLFISYCSRPDYGFKSDKEIGNLLLTTQAGKKKFYDFNAEGYLFFFGYSRCNTTCPMGLQAFHRLYENPKFPKTILPIFVSIDLARDNWENLSRLQENYGRSILFILPESDFELQRLTKEFEIQFSKTNSMDTNYQINHTGNIYFVDSKFKLSRIFTSSQRDVDRIGNEIMNSYKGEKYANSYKL